MSHACHRFWKCYKTLTFCSLWTRCTIPCACHAKAHLNVQKCSVPLSLLHFWLRNVLRATTACTFSTCQLPKVVRTWCALYILTSKCALRHNGMHFFDIATSKSGPNLVCFVHFDFEMRFAPQPRALFRHLNFQKWSEREVLFSFFTYKCASRHNGVQFFISHLARWLRTRRFSEPTFRPSGATNHWKKQCFAPLLPFRASASSFFWLFLFSDLLSSTLLFSLTLPISAFHLSILSEVLTSKLPSIICYKQSTEAFQQTGEKTRNTKTIQLDFKWIPIHLKPTFQEFSWIFHGNFIPSSPFLQRRRWPFERPREATRGSRRRPPGWRAARHSPGRRPARASRCPVGTPPGGAAVAKCKVAEVSQIGNL